MYKLIIENSVEPTYISFEDNQPDLNINPDETVTIVLPVGSTVEVEKNHIILSGVKRPNK